MAAPSDACGLAEALFKQLNDLIKSNSYQQLNDIAAENAQLRRKRGDWEVTNRTNLETLVSLQHQLDARKAEASAQATQLSKLTKEKEDIEAILASKTKSAEETDKQLEAKKSEITTLTTTLKQAEAGTGQLKKQKAEGDKSLAATKDDKAKLEKELAQLQADFAKQAERLSRLEKLEHKLQKPQKDDLCRRLRDIFESLDTLVQTYIGDLDKDVLSDSTTWKNFIEHDAFKAADIPFPPTNSANAKSTRRAAVLCICTWALELHIFQSSHLVDKSNQLSEILDELADDEPERAAYTRSILLRLQHDRLRDSSYARADIAVEAVSKCTKIMIPDTSKQATFDASLKNIFMAACKLWREVQGMKPKMAASTYESETEDWELVPLRRQPNGKKSDQLPNGNVRVNGDTGSKSKKPNAPKPGAVPDPIMIVLWPAFQITENKHTETFMKGYAVTESELTATRDELSKAQEARRANRLNYRTANPKRRLSVSQSNGQTNGGEPFLDQGGSG